MLSKVKVTDKTWSVKDTNMPGDWFDFLGPNKTHPENCEILFCSDSAIGAGIDHPCKIALLIEPPGIHGYVYVHIHEHKNEFKLILTHIQEIIDSIPHAVYCPFGGGWIQPDDWKIYPKEKNCSIVVSGKRSAPGHILRHEVLESTMEGFDRFGFMNPIPNNYQAMIPYRYNICIENTRQDYYFTEKLIDCFSTGTVPLFWGSPGIDTIFNTEGMICFETKEQLAEILPTLTPELYQGMMPAIQENLELSKQYWSYERNIANTLFDYGKHLL